MPPTYGCVHLRLKIKQFVMRHFFNACVRLRRRVGLRSRDTCMLRRNKATQTTEMSFEPEFRLRLCRSISGWSRRREAADARRAIQIMRHLRPNIT